MLSLSLWIWHLTGDHEGTEARLPLSRLLLLFRQALRLQNSNACVAALPTVTYIFRNMHDVPHAV
jgi:hypothetical protein